MCLALVALHVCSCVFLAVPPQIAPFDFGDEPVNSGDDVNVFCQVNKGDFPIGIKWTFNDKPVDNIQGVTITRTNKRVSQLTIDSVQAQHAGRYVCGAKNQAGVDRYSAALRVNGTTTISTSLVPFCFCFTQPTIYSSTTADCPLRFR